jgi:VanZ family protein
MDRARRLQTTARWLLLIAGSICAIGMVGPFKGVEHRFIPWDKAAHFVAFYGVTLLLFSAFPKRRRFDLVMLATFSGAAIEVLQLLDGRDAELGDLAADAVGAFAVLTPIYLERLGKPRPDRRRRAAAAEPITKPEVA